jgi:hypothetical protein
MKGGGEEGGAEVERAIAMRALLLSRTPRTPRRKRGLGRFSFFLTRTRPLRVSCGRLPWHSTTTQHSSSGRVASKARKLSIKSLCSRTLIACRRFSGSASLCSFPLRRVTPSAQTGLEQEEEAGQSKARAGA